MEYIIATASSAIELESAVAGLIANNWLPLGGVSVACDGRQVVLAQSMTRIEKEEVAG